MNAEPRASVPRRRCWRCCRWSGWCFTTSGGRWPGRRFANVDHVVVGPAGVFVIDSKNWSGSITVRAGVLRQNGRLRESTVSGAAEAARAVARQFSTLSPSHVHPVLCFVRDERITGRARGVMVCSTGNLLDLLLTRSPVLTEGMRERAFRELAQCRPVESEGTTPRRPLRTTTTPLPRRRVRRSRGVGYVLGRFTGFVAVVSVLFAMLTTDLPDHIAQVLRLSPTEWCRSGS